MPTKTRTMFSTKLLLLSAALFSSALAQAKIAFTSVPAVAIAGQSYNISWGGGDGSSVTITLREGELNALKTISTLADGVDETFFVWNVSKSLATASDYALQITQGQGVINYSGQFSIAGGSGTSTISVSGASTATTASNATVPLTATRTPTASAGTSTLIASNATFSSATLHTTSTSLIAASTQHLTTSPSSAGFGDLPSSTSAAQTAAATTNAPDSAGAGQLGSSAAMVMGVFAAVMFLS